MTEKTAYTQAASSGKYEKPSGLLGKYDNVRRLWEDHLTGICMRRHLSQMIERKQRKGEKIRILDMGCGSGDAYDLIMGIPSAGQSLADADSALLQPEMLDAYVGIDVNTELLKQAERYWSRNTKMHFIAGDLCGSLPQEVLSGPPFDIYFTSYGTLAHFHDKDNTKLFASICSHAEPHAMVIGDWLGRYSYEWQELWSSHPESEYFMDYRISYIYPEEERCKVDVSSFPLRLMTRNDIIRIADAASAMSKARITPLDFYDRSIFVGRHLDTGDYNKQAPPLRRLINSLLEPNVRTDLSQLHVTYEPLKGFDSINRQFEKLFHAFNCLVRYVEHLIMPDVPLHDTMQAVQEGNDAHHTMLRHLMSVMKKTVSGVEGADHIDARAAVIEPMLAFGLREIETALQPGAGLGHSIAGVFEVAK